jgi:hypothetical protein
MKEEGMEMVGRVEGKEIEGRRGVRQGGDGGAERGKRGDFFKLKGRPGKKEKIYKLETKL